jgi:hypothetical protein
MEHRVRRAPEQADSPLSIRRNIIKEQEELSLTFAERVSQIEEVKKVMLTNDKEGLRIWTILDREPNNRELRNRIYDVEAEVLDRFPEVGIDFRLINLAEYSNSDGLHIPSHKVVYERG